ncbi:TSC22 domain family protein 1-like, partial [Ctenocephalides felis]|uniref:TSC22 domain family protein 1-like n=1 Tax=Ctenocephalides felis TaxID=7515 RepID=UPI000E6E35BB
MARRVASNHYVATHSSPEGYLVRNGHSNVAYSTDGEDSHRAASEYMISNERSLSPNPRKPRSSSHQHLNHHHHSSQQALSVPSVHRHGSHAALTPSGGPPSRPPPRAPSQLSFGDNGSDIYVTSAAYKAPSEI